jgi:hypothetical protein
MEAQMTHYTRTKMIALSAWIMAGALGAQAVAQTPAGGFGGRTISGQTTNNLASARSAPTVATLPKAPVAAPTAPSANKLKSSVEKKLEDTNAGVIGKLAG